MSILYIFKVVFDDCEAIDVIPDLFFQLENQAYFLTVMLYSIIARK